MNILIVNYHYVGSNSYPFPGVNGLTTEAFHSQIRLIKSKYQITCLSDLKSLQSGGNHCILTFDDGLKCHLANVLPVLISENVTGAFFISGQPLMEQTALVTHKLHYILANLHFSKLDGMLNEFLLQKGLSHLGQVEKKIVSRHYRYDNSVTARFKFIINYKLGPHMREEFVTGVYIEEFGDDGDFIDQWYMTESDISLMHKHGNTIGCHAYSHQPLATLGSSEILYELTATKDYLEKCLLQKVDSVSYPLGNKLAIDERVIRIADEVGYQIGLTMERGINTSLSNPLLLKRIDANDLQKFIP